MEHPTKGDDLGFPPISGSLHRCIVYPKKMANVCAHVTCLMSIFINIQQVRKKNGFDILCIPRRQ